MSSGDVGSHEKSNFEPLGESESEVERSQDNLDYFRKMNLDRTTGVDRSLSIMCKMGPSTADVEVLEEMIVAGMNIAMIKCGEMEGEDHIRETVRKIRDANDIVNTRLKLMYPVAICMKTIGPELHIGVHEEGADASIKLETGSQVTITFDSAYKEKCNKDVIFVDFPRHELLDLKLRNRILLNRGLIKLKIYEIDINYNGNAFCDVVIGGMLPSRAVISFPDSLLSMPTVSEEDNRYIQLAIELRLDIIMLTHLQSFTDVEEVRERLRERHCPMFICASLTDIMGFCNADEIIKAADGICIPRGYLERKPFSWNLFLSTKIIVAKCRSVGKPTIITSRLLSAINDNKKEPLLPDIVNAAQVVLEGVDCFGLGNEVASGENPVQCIRTFVATCREANKQVDKEELIDEISTVVRKPCDMLLTLHSSEVMKSVNFSAVTLSLRINAAAIIVLTTSGRSASCLSQLRPVSPIIAITRTSPVARQLVVFKHVYPVQYLVARREDWMEDLDARIQFGITYGKYRGFIKAGDPIIVLHGRDKGSGSTNTIRLVYASKVNVPM